MGISFTLQTSMNMALFKVPCWSIPTAPIQEDSPRTFRKRKLSSTNQTEEVRDWARQLKKLSHEQSATSKDFQKSQVYGKKVKEKPKDIPGPSSVAGVTGRKKKKREKIAHALPNRAEAPNNPVIPLTDLQKRMKETLDGARFRCVVFSCLVSQ